MGDGLRAEKRAPLTVQPIEANCSRKYRARRTGGSRPLSAIRLVVLHDAEAAHAESVAAYFESEHANGSAHLCVDDTACYRTLDNVDVPWGAPGANTQGFHIEQAGFARWSAVVWRSHRRTLQRAAYKTAYHCHLFGIPPTFRFAAALRAGRAGITTHAECTRAFGGDHTDPGPLWPRRLFMRYVREYHAALDAR